MLTQTLTDMSTVDTYSAAANLYNFMTKAIRGSKVRKRRVLHQSNNKNEHRQIKTKEKKKPSRSSPAEERKNTKQNKTKKETTPNKTKKETKNAGT